MRYCLRFIRSNTLCLYSALIAFSLAATPSVHAFGPIQVPVGLNDIAFGIKMEKLIEKIKKYKGKLDQTKMLDTMVELKIEVEGYTGKKINMDKELDRVENEMKKGGARLSKEEFNKIRKVIKSAENRSNHKVMYMAECLAYNLDYDAELEQLTYSAKQTNEKEDTTLPPKVIVGVTMALCGSFLGSVPIAICQASGPVISKGGIALAIEGTL